MMPFPDHSSAFPLPLDKEMRVLFYELGIIGINNLLGYEALQLFADLKTAEPEAAYPVVGLGVVALATADFNEAQRNFTDPIVRESPLAPFAQGYLALSYKLSGNHGGFHEASAAAAEGSNGNLKATLDDLEHAVIDFSQH